MTQIQEFDYNVDLLQAILWQYNNAENLQSIINQKQEWYDLNQTQFWTDWYNNVFNLSTANEFGLSVWAVILNVPLYINTGTEPFPPTGIPIIGFNAYTTYPTLINDYENFAGSGLLPFSQNGILNNTINVTGLSNTVPMYVGMPVSGTGIPSGTTIASIVSSTAITLSAAATVSATESLTFDTSPGIGANFSDLGSRYILTTEQQRIVLQLRYFQLVTRGAVPEINTFLNYLSQQESDESVWGEAWVLDSFLMKIRYVFNFAISPILLQILQDLDLLPRPSGVGIQYYVVSDRIFGFDPVGQNFAGVGTTTFIMSGILNSTTSVTGLSATQGMYVGMSISGTGIPAGTTIASIVSSTAITLSAAATVSATENLQFDVPVDIGANFAPDSFLLAF